MERIINNTVLELVKGDIATQDTEAIVNAANKRLAPGGGVAGAIHRAAGPRLWNECEMLNGCETGEAKITQGYNLQAKYVIHTVGPVYRGDPQDKADLRSCYWNSLELAEENHVKSISFPAISTGAFEYPLEEAARISISTVKRYLESENTDLELVRFVLYSQHTYEAYLKALEKFVIT